MDAERERKFCDTKRGWGAGEGDALDCIGFFGLNIEYVHSKEYIPLYRKITHYKIVSRPKLTLNEIHFDNILRKRIEIETETPRVLHPLDAPNESGKVIRLTGGLTSPF
jgi:hypothetical protein